MLKAGSRIVAALYVGTRDVTAAYARNDEVSGGGVPPDPQPSAQRYVAATQQGNGSGDSFANARALADLNDVIANTLPGGTIRIRGDDSIFAAGTPIVISNGGTLAAPITILHVKESGLPPAEILGSRTAWTLPGNSETTTDTSGWNHGTDIFELQAGADHLVFERMNVALCGNAFNITGSVENIEFKNCIGYNVRRYCEMADGLSVQDLTIDGLTVTGFSKHCVRFRGNSSGFVLRNFALNSGRQDKDNFACGVQLGGLVGVPSDILIENGFANNCHSSLGSYWNGDGIVAEEGITGLVINNVTANGHTDGGFDLKSSCDLTNCTAIGNKYNMRLWNGTFDLDNCDLQNPIMRGGVGKRALIETVYNAGPGPVVVNLTNTCNLVAANDINVFEHGTGPSIVSTFNVSADTTYTFDFGTDIEDYSNSSTDANCSVNWTGGIPALPNFPPLNPNPFGKFAVDGAPGTQPDTWTLEADQFTLARTLLTTDDYFSARWTGTMTGTASTRIDNIFNGLADVAAVSGNKRSAFMDVDIIDHTGSNFATFTGWGMRALGYSDVGAETESSLATFVPLTGRRVYKNDRTMNNAGTDFARARQEVTVYRDQVIDLEYRFYLAGVRAFT